MSGFPYIFTFYSFKGGVGRSMALLNTAYTLAGWGRHVLIVDLDLEAPGVSGFLQRHNELAPPATERSLDILTLLGEVLSAAASGKQAREIAEGLPPLANYLRNVDPKNLAPLAPKFGTVGRLDVIAADMGRDWCRRLAELGLSGLPQDRLLTVSSALHFYFKSHRFAHRPLGLEEFDPAQPTPYDYILVDSRTGITDVGGLCVGPLADRLVVLSALNDQNIQGTLAFLKEAGIEPKRRARDSQPWDHADNAAGTEDPTLGPKPTLLVASPVPNGEIAFKKQRLDELEKLIGIRPARLSYHPQMALLEGVFVRDYQEEYLAREYKELAERLTRQVGDHPRQIVAGIPPPSQKVDSDTVKLALRVASMDSTGGFAVLAQQANSFKASSDAGLLIARQLCAALVADNVSAYRSFFNWGCAFQEQSKLRIGDEVERLLAAACAKYSEALRLKPDKFEALNNWGTALLALAKRKEGVESDRLLWESRERLKQAEGIKAGSAAYNLACLEAWLRNAQSSIEWLKIAVSSGREVTAAMIAADRDFDSVRNDPQFTAFLQTL